MKSIAAAPLPVVLVLLSFLAPSELSLFVAGLRLPPHRIALLLTLAFALKRLASRRTRIGSFDILFALFGAWTAIGFFLHLGQSGLVYGGSLALESFGSYVVARAYIRTRAQFLASLSILMLLVCAAGLIALPEMLLGRHFTHDAMQSLTGYVVERSLEMRKGLTRATGTFDHPIHLGVFCSSVLALGWYTARGVSQRMRRTLIIIVATLTALSSAPFLCLALQIAMMIWERTTRGVARRVMLTSAVMAGVYLGASLALNRTPIELIATGLTLDSWTGYYRLLIWQYGIENVLNHPWIGLGKSDWERPHWMAAQTVDAFWLVIAMTQGIPALLLLFAAMAALMRAVGLRIKRTSDKAERHIGRAWMMSLIALSLMACTVHLWNVPYAYFFFFLGSAGWLADPPRLKQRQARPRVRVAAEPLPRFMTREWPAASARPALAPSAY